MRKQPQPAAAARVGPLAGVRVLELGVLLAGPFATRMLADLGADVIKVERPDRPDPLREWGNVRHRGRPLMWPIMSRNKRCISLDLSRPRGRELFLDLVKISDVVVENFRPGALERLGLGYDDLTAANPQIILTRVSGYGQTGPYAGRAGFASAAEAMSGLRALNGFPNQPPPRLGISLGDSLGALFAVQGVLAALYHRDVISPGTGQVVDVSLVESCFALLESVAPEYALAGIEREPSGTGLASIAPSNIFKSSDGKWLVIAANHDSLFTRLCDVMEMPELASSDRFATHQARGENQAEIERIIAEWASVRTAKEIDHLLNTAGVVCGPVYGMADIFADPHFREREMLVEHTDAELGTFLGPGVFPKFSDTPGRVDWTGESGMASHNEDVFCGLLELAPDELAGLAEDGIV